MELQWWMVVALVVVIVVGVVAVRIYPPPGPTISGPLPRGWQLYSRPTGLEPPGTVFRIDDQGRRFLVNTLKVPFAKGAEGSDRQKATMTAKMGIVSQILSQTLRIGVESARDEQLTFEIKGVEHEVAQDTDLDPALAAFVKDMQRHQANRYYVIHDCRLAKEMTLELTQTQVDELGGEASVSEALKAEGKVLQSKANREYALKQTFDTPLRVMFLADEVILPARAMGEEVAAPTIRRQRVTEPLLWTTED